MIGLLAAVHLHPAAGVPVALLVLFGLGLYLRTLDGDGVPAPRRRVRRVATATMMVGVLALLVSISFADPTVNPTLYVSSWSVVFMVLLGMVGLAAVDIAVSTWLIGLEKDGEAMRRGATVLAALEAESARRAERRETGQWDAGGVDPVDVGDAGDAGSTGDAANGGNDRGGGTP